MTSPYETYLAAELEEREAATDLEAAERLLVLARRDHVRASDRYTAALEAKNAAREAMEAQQQPAL